MSAHRVDVFNFEFWHGPPPGLAYEHGSSFNRPGADGVGQQRLGKWGDQFEVELVSWWNSYQSALQAIPLMQSIVRTGWVLVTYNSVNYFYEFAHGYFVDVVEPLHCQKVLRLVGPGINLINGAELITRFTMTPYSLL